MELYIFLFFASTKDSKKIEEEVDDVQVEVEGGEDVLLGADGILVVTAEHDLGVVDDIKREDDRPDRGVPDLCPPEEICFRYKYDKKVSCTEEKE